MPFLKNIYRNNKLFVIISSLIFILLLVVSLINGRFGATDFEVYYYAAKSFLNGKQVYGIAFGGSDVGFYKYSPFTLLLYIPAGLLPFKLAAVVNYILISTASILVISLSSYLVMANFFNQKERIGNALLFITFFLSLTFINRDLMLGNTNILLLLIICLALLTIQKSHPYLAGFLFAVSILMKPYLLIVALPLLTHRKYKALASTALFSLLFIILPFLFSGWHSVIELYKGWIASLLDHNNYIISPFTFDSLLKKYLIGNTTFDFTFYVIILVAVVYIIISMFIKVKQNETPSGNRSDQFFVLETFTLLALIPNLVNTDTQQLLYTIPLIAFLVQYQLTKRNPYLIILYLVLFFFFSIDQPDLLGRSLSESIYRFGVAGIANLLIICLSWIIFLKDNISFFSKPKASG